MQHCGTVVLVLLVFGPRLGLQQFSCHLHWITLSQNSEVHLRTNPPRINGDRRLILHSSLVNDSQPVQCSNALNILHHLRYDSPITFLTSLYPERDLNYPDSPPILLSGSPCERQTRLWITLKQHCGTVLMILLVFGPRLGLQQFSCNLLAFI